MTFAKRLFFLVFIIFASVFVGKAQDFIPPSDGKAVVYFTRTSTLGALINFKFYHNDEYIGKCKGGEYVRYECEPGEHLFWANSENRSFVNANLEEGGIYVIEARPKMGAFKARVLLEPVLFEDIKPALLRRLTKMVDHLGPVEPTDQELDEMNASLEDYIVEGLVVYQRRSENDREIAVLTPDMRF